MTLCNYYVASRYDAAFAEICHLAKENGCFVQKSGTSFFIKGWREEKAIHCSTASEVKAYFRAKGNARYHTSREEYENVAAVQHLDIPQKRKRPRFVVTSEKVGHTDPAFINGVVFKDAKVVKPISIVEKIEEFLNGLALQRGVNVVRKEGFFATTITLSKGYNRYASVSIPTNGKPALFKTSKAGKPFAEFLDWRKSVRAQFMAF